MALRSSTARDDVTCDDVVCDDVTCDDVTRGDVSYDDVTCDIVRWRHRITAVHIHDVIAVHADACVWCDDVMQVYKRYADAIYMYVQSAYTDVRLCITIDNLIATVNIGWSHHIL